MLHGPTHNLPSYRLHRPSGQAVVTLSGHDHYLGIYGTPESRETYDRLVSEWLAHGRCLGRQQESLKIINEIILSYWDFCVRYYGDGEPGKKEMSALRSAMRPLKQLYGSTPAPEFGPLRLKTVREALIATKISRTSVNRAVSRIKRMFRWATENELVPPSVFHGLQALSGLKWGRTNAPDHEPVRPVPQARVDAVLPRVSRQVAAMIKLQLLTGMRPGELAIMRTVDIDLTGRIWIYVPERHKTERFGYRRDVFIGPQAQEVLRPFLKNNLQAFLFSPAEAEAERHAEQRLYRKTRVQPSQQNRRRKNPKRAPRDRYDVASYRRAIQRTCQAIEREMKAKDPESTFPSWHPHQLRHNFATRVRKEHGLEITRILLGQKSLAVAEIYAERDAEAAAAVMDRVG